MTTTSEDELPDGVDNGSAPPPVRSDVYISADIEADGPIPGRFSMLSLGMCVAGEQDAAGTFRPIQPESARFYRELRPISDAYEPAALAAISASGIDRDRLLRSTASNPQTARIEGAAGAPLQPQPSLKSGSFASGTPSPSASPGAGPPATSTTAAFHPSTVQESQADPSFA